jgi:hypothetical protein
MFESLTTVGILVAFLVPGYVWRITEGKFVYLDRRLEWEKFAFGLLTRSTFLYLPWTPLLYRAYSNRWYDSAPWRTLLIFAFIAIVQPIVFGVLWGKFRQCGCEKRVFKFLRLGPLEQGDPPSAWDAVFSNRPESWIIVTLKDNSRVRGWFGIRSHASSDEGQRDLFVSHVLTE